MAGRRREVRQARAHWLLLLLGLLVLGALLTLQGYASGVLQGGSGPSGPAAGSAEDGPLMRFDSGLTSTRRVPDKTIVLTFDDGPDPRWTPEILAALARHQVKATFFVVGSRVNEEPDLARRILAEGHELGVHSFTHARLDSLPGWRRGLEISLTANAIAGATGQHTTLFRPPYSSEPSALTAAERRVIAELPEYVTVLSDVDTKDWQRPGVTAIVGSVALDGRGSVVLMHDGGGDRSQTVAALDLLIPKLKQQGYTFTTVAGALGGPPAVVPASIRAQWSGDAMRWAQRTAGLVTASIEVLLLVALVLAVLRLLLQLITARIHVRRRQRRGVEILAPVSVIVPAYNEAANIAATVLSLVASDYPYLEVIVVDDGSTDGTADIVEGLSLPEVLVLRQPNGGKPAALNTGIRAARGDYLILVDGDTVFEPDTVYRIVQGFADPSVGAIAGNTKVANRRGLLGRWQHLEYVIGFNLDRRFYDVAGCMPTIPGAIGAFRFEVLDGVRGVSADTLAEDTDLTMSVLRMGWKVVYCPDAIAWTEAPSSLRQLWRQRYRWCYGTMQAAWKHRRARGPLGRVGLPYLLLFQVLLPLIAPAIDIYAGYAAIFLPGWQIALTWFGLLGFQALIATIALRLDGESLRPLWSIIFQQIVYRQLMYLVVVQSAVTALIGNRLRWQRMHRTGSAAALLESA